MKLFTVLTVAAAVIGASGAACAQGPDPLYMTNAAIGGGPLNQYTPGVEGGTGLNNIGLLIKTYGKVEYRDLTNKYFYINDGSGRDDGSGHPGIRVGYDNLAPEVTITPPDEGAYVSVTGVISTVMISSKIQPNLRPRRQADIEPYP